MSLLQNSNAISEGGGYNLDNSLRFRSSASARLSRTPTVSGNQQKFTISCWVKRGALTGYQTIFCLRAISSSTPYWFIGFDDSTNIFSLNSNNGALYTTQVFRDPSAWYHIVYEVDTTQATASNRLKLYINGTQVTAFGVTSYPGLNANTGVNSTVAHWIGAATNGAGTINQFYDGYITEFNLIDGQALTPSDFGETNEDTGVWQPIEYTGTYGTNGFYINGSTSASTVLDQSGNSNNWTATNMNLTTSTATTYDIMTDVPTLTDEDTANYAVWNPLVAGGLVTFSEANLKTLSTSAAAPYNISATMNIPNSGKWYCEITALVGASNPLMGISSVDNESSFSGYRVNGTYINNISGAASSGTPSTYTTNDVIGIAYDADAGTLNFYKSGVAQAGGFTSIPATGLFTWMVRKDSASGDGGYLNCGQRPFAYTPPAGSLKLNTFNLPDSSIVKGNEYFDTVPYTGNGASQTIPLNFSPDFVWLKGRSIAYNNFVFDSVRGINPSLITNSTAAETSTTAYVQPNSPTGFTLGNSAFFNQGSQTFVSWSWKAGGTAVSNTAGTITSSVSANTTAGFSIVTYTGNGTGGATFGHSLGVAPSMVIVKNRTASPTAWVVYHQYANASPASGGLRLNLTDAFVTYSPYWNNTTPSSTVVTLGSDNQVNGSTNAMVAYCFAEVEGYSKFGKYTGNGSTDGPFTFTGFKPAYVMIKRTNAAGESWLIRDTARTPTNVSLLLLNAENSNAEGSNTLHYFDFLSNGFKIRNGTWGGHNANGGAYIYMAFASNPFKNSLAQ